MKKFFIIVMILFVCGCRKDPIHIGTKPFTEQLILGEMLAQLCEEHGIPVERSFPYGSTFSCAQALREGDLDIYIEYNGTGLMLLGYPASQDGDKAQEMVKQKYAKQGIAWGERIGFANDYVLLMRRDLATAWNVKKISDLHKFMDKTKFGCAPEFIKRPLDGYHALLRTYGIKSETPPLQELDKNKLYRALLDRKINIAVGYGTDGQIATFDLLVLEDDMNFFPVYEAAPLVNKKTLESNPQLGDILKKMANIIDTPTMRKLNGKVELQGANYRLVAWEFLKEKELISEVKPKRSHGKKLNLAMETLERSSIDAARALMAVRKAFPGRTIEVAPSPTPRKMVEQGKARLALLGAESFFEVNANGIPVQLSSVEAIALVGYRMCHLLTKKDSQKTIQQMKKIGVGVPNGNSHIVANIMLSALLLKDKVEVSTGKLAEQIEQLKQGQLDALLLMVSPGHSLVTSLMAENDMKLLALTNWHQSNYVFRYPFLRLSHIAPNTYQNQTQPVATVSTQLVLCSLAPKHKIVGNTGPATAYTEQQSLSRHTIVALEAELGMKERIDPILPASKHLTPKRRAPKKLNPSYHSSLLNMLVILACIYLMYLFVQEEEYVKKK